METFVIILAAICLYLLIATVTGAIAVWALSVFGLVTFSWLKALAAGLLLGAVASIFKNG